jgi:tocopherol cyclase
MTANRKRYELAGGNFKKGGLIYFNILPTLEINMIRKIQSFFNPEQFQGWYKKKRYFEGWYYKIVDANEKYAFAIIPGIAMDKKGEKHAFIQILDGRKLSSGYHKFDFDSFTAKPGKFHITIGGSIFSANYLYINLPEIQGKLEFHNIIPWPKPFYSPGIMGPYSFAPFMECYHGIVSMDHSITGRITYNNQNINFDHGRGYIEKDWGRSFPRAYFWLQSNHFSQPGISLKASVAKIPWLNGFFTGFICGIWLNGKLIRFTTYNKSVLWKSFANEETVELAMENKKYSLYITARRDHSAGLAAPVHGLMTGRIEESMNATLEITLSDLIKNRLILKDTGRNACLEVAGDIQEIFV